MKNPLLLKKLVIIVTLGCLLGAAAFASDGGAYNSSQNLTQEDVESLDFIWKPIFNVIGWSNGIQFFTFIIFCLAALLLVGFAIKVGAV